MARPAKPTIPEFATTAELVAWHKKQAEELEKKALLESLTLDGIQSIVFDAGKQTVTLNTNTNDHLVIESGDGYQANGFSYVQRFAPSWIMTPTKNSGFSLTPAPADLLTLEAEVPAAAPGAGKRGRKAAG
jgi:hypothetical protein